MEALLEGALKPSKTEERNPRSRGLDTKSTLGILRVMNREDARVALAVRRELPAIARAVDAIVKSVRAGGRLFYIGAGTSGRLAAIDAAECPPTFGTPPKMVHAIIAGGARAMRGAVEGAEDSAANGARDLAAARLKRGDVVVGLAASGTTPYVLGALELARKRRRGDGRRHFESAFAARGECAHRYHAGHRPGSDCRLDAPEGRHVAENGPQPAFYCSDGAARQSLRELDDLRGADKSEVAAKGGADT
jgi:phosphoheptose isomerase